MNNLKRPIFGIFREKIKIGQLFDLQDECFLESSILKTELSPAIRVYDEKSVKIEVFNRPFFAEFISSLSDDSFTQFKAHLNIGIFKTLTTDPRIFSPNSDALISIKFTFRKKVLKLKDLDSNALELDEKFIAKSQFVITEIEMGQWILVSVSAKNDLENDVLKLEVGLPK
uniref:Uncharacterized protein n=1 Tax=Panagrolaimus davidi TaxID=227884 RepID=A0A914P578_9BILA